MKRPNDDEERGAFYAIAYLDGLLHDEPNTHEEFNRAMNEGDDVRSGFIGLLTGLAMQTVDDFEELLDVCPGDDPPAFLRLWRAKNLATAILRGEA